jgi:predicted permease
MLLMESLLLGLLGGGLGVLLAPAMLRLLLRLIPVELPFWMRLEVDAFALSFALALALAAGALSGIVPAWQLSGRGLAGSLKEAARGASGGRASSGIKRGLVVAETALALMMVVGAGLMMQSFVRLIHVESGVRSEGLVAAYVSRFVTNVSREQLVVPYTFTYDRVMARLRELPGVTHVGGSYAIPYKEQGEQRTKQTFVVRGQSQLEERQNAPAVASTVSPTYFETLGIPLLAGRTFSDADTPGSEPVLIVNRRMADTLWPGREAIGQKVLRGKETIDNAWATVVGVVGDTKWNAAEAPGFEIYFSHRQWPVPALHLVVRAQGDSRLLMPAVRRAIHEVEPDLAINDIKTMDTIVSESLWQRRLWGVLLSAFAASALLLGGLGLYGVMSHAVGQRTRELGVRMALGARSRDVLSLVLGEGMRLALAGTALGLLGALGMSRLLASLLFGVSGSDAPTLVAAAAMLALAALLASLLPALRASRVDPAVCLRSE